MSSAEELKLKSSEILERNKKLAIDLSKNILSEPETGYKEFKTNKKIYDTLNSLGLQVQNNLAVTG